MTVKASRFGGEGVPIEPDQDRNIHLTEQQAFDLAKRVLAEYEVRTGGSPLRVVLHKTSFFDPAEQAGFTGALKDTPIVSMITLVPSLFRLLRYGSYPPKVGTVCTVNGDRSYLFTSGFMPELGTYPGPPCPATLRGTVYRCGRSHRWRTGRAQFDPHELEHRRHPRQMARFAVLCPPGRRYSGRVR